MPLDRQEEAMHQRMSRLAALVAALAVLATLTACGSDATTEAKATTSTTAGGYPVTVRGTNGDVTVAARPSHIVSMSPTATEMLFAIGAGKQVVAVDSNSNYPAEAPTTKLSSYEPNVEAISGYEPDLVILSDDINDVVAGLGKLKIATLQLSAAKTLDDTYAQIETLGEATGHKAQATGLVASMRSKLAALAEQAPKPAQPLRYYHELDDTLYTVTSDTFIGQIYGMAGLENIADAVPDKAGGYPQLSAEFIVQADPDMVFLADTKCCNQSTATVAARAGWAQLKAVTGKHVVTLDDDVASRWGPRVTDLLATIVKAAKAAAA
jgi:iron complex transport system substrate-binding protein